MEIFELDSSRNTHIEQVDNQHKQLFKMINEYFLAIKEAKANDVLAETIDKLLDCAINHFDFEETLFTKYS